MVLKDLSWSIANNILFFTNILNTVKIENLDVPELIQLGNTSDVILDCRYSAIDERLTVNWYFNRSSTPVYSWSPHTEPIVSGILGDRLDLNYKASDKAYDQHRALHIVKLDPVLSGEYTCSVISDVGETHQTRNMLIFSAEREFLLEWHYFDHNLINIRCLARGLYPKPDLVLEYNRVVIPRQTLRVWRNEGVLYDSECVAQLSVVELAESRNAITCRLRLPHSGYSAFKEQAIDVGKYADATEFQNKSTYFDDGSNNRSSRFTLSRAYILLYLFLLLLMLCNILKNC